MSEGLRGGEGRGGVGGRRGVCEVGGARARGQWPGCARGEEVCGRGRRAGGGVWRVGSGGWGGGGGEGGGAGREGGDGRFPIISF